MTDDTHADERSELLRPSDVARIFNVKPGTVRLWARLGKIPAIKTPGGHSRYRRSDVERVLAGEAVAS